MLSAVYSFEVKRERKEEILEAWAFITRDPIRSCGSLRSRMHRGKDGGMKYEVPIIAPKRC